MTEIVTLPAEYQPNKRPVVSWAFWGPEGIEIGTHEADHGASVMIDVLNERGRQMLKWGRQHVPIAVTIPGAHAYYGLPTADEAKATEQRKAKIGATTWVDIALEEFCEMIEAHEQGDTAHTREEAIQTIAVLVAMVEQMDGAT